MDYELEPPADLATTGIDMWQTLTAGRKLTAVHLALIHNCCRIGDRLDELALELRGRLVVQDVQGKEEPNPLLTEHRQQFLALRAVLKDLKLMEIPEDSSSREVSALDRWIESRGFGVGG